MKISCEIILMVATLIIGGCQNDDEPTNQSNVFPIAHAGDDQKAEIGTVVKLDASASSGPQNKSLSFNWSFLNKPSGSAAAIIGVAKEQAEFTLDKAGIYEVQLTVSDGTQESSDQVVVTNRTPVLSEVSTSTTGALGSDLAEIGLTISISGDFFSSDINETSVTLGETRCTIEDLNVGGSTDFIRVIVPHDARSGNLTVIVGEEFVTWVTPIKIVHRPLTLFIDSDPTFEERERDRSDYKEVGTLFKPQVNGEVVGFTARTPDRTDIRVALWDVSTKTVLASESLETRAQGGEVYRRLASRVPLEAGKEYLITLNSNEWYFHISNPRRPIYPITVGNFEILAGMATDADLGDPAPPSDFVYPERTIDDFIVLGAEIVFATDPQ